MVLQVAAELGIVGLGGFLFLVGRAVMSPAKTRRLLKVAGGIPGRRKKQLEPGAVVTPAESEWRGLTSAMIAALAGWFCALFMSPTTGPLYLWLAVAPRDS